jgi:hypothetical protein
VLRDRRGTAICNIGQAAKVLECHSGLHATHWLDALAIPAASVTRFCTQHCISNQQTQAYTLSAHTGDTPWLTAHKCHIPSTANLLTSPPLNHIGDGPLSPSLAPHVACTGKLTITAT